MKTKQNTFVRQVAASVIIAAGMASLGSMAAAQTAGKQRCTASMVSGMDSLDDFCSCAIVTQGTIRAIQNRPDFPNILAGVNAQCPALAAVLTDLPTQATARPENSSENDQHGLGPEGFGAASAGGAGADTDTDTDTDTGTDPGGDDGDGDGDGEGDDGGHGDGHGNGQGNGAGNGGGNGCGQGNGHGGGKGGGKGGEGGEGGHTGGKGGEGGKGGHTGGEGGEGGDTGEGSGHSDGATGTGGGETGTGSDTGGQDSAQAASGNVDTLALNCEPGDILIDGSAVPMPPSNG